MEPVFEEVDTRDEGFSLDAVLVKVIWVTVGSCDQDNAMRHKSFEKPSFVSDVIRGAGATYRLNIIASATSVH